MNYIEEAENYLRHYYDLHRSLQNMRRERGKLIGRSAPKGYSEKDYTQPRPSNMSGQDDAYDVLFKIKTLTDNIQKTEGYLEEVNIILDEISVEPGCELFGDILRKWYIEKLPREEIAQESQYCERNIYKIKDKAIRKFAVNIFGLDAVSIV